MRATQCDALFTLQAEFGASDEAPLPPNVSIGSTSYIAFDEKGCVGQATSATPQMPTSARTDLMVTPILQHGSFVFVLDTKRDGLYQHSASRYTLDRIPRPIAPETRRKQFPRSGPRAR
jgi:hypothetical protein